VNLIGAAKMRAGPKVKAVPDTNSETGTKVSDEQIEEI
jgi:hypothetical protein